MNISTANRLVQYRKQRGLSQEELAAELGLSRQAVSKWERAEASPDTDNLIALAKLYGVSLDTLLLSDEPVSSSAQQRAGTADSFAEPPPAAPDIDELMEGKLNEALGAELLSAFEGKEEKVTGMHRKLSPAARRFLDLLLLGAFGVFMVIYGLLSLIFPQLKGAYAVLCTIIYLLLGFYADWWHPGWMVYLSIPLFYTIF